MKAGLAVALGMSTLLAGPSGAQDWAYQPAGRRDPFVGPGGPSSAPRRCSGAGLESLLVQEVALRGLVASASGRTALLTSADGRAFFAVVGQRLCDGQLVRIEAGAIVMTQRSTDPLMPEGAESTVRRVLH